MSKTLISGETLKTIGQGALGAMTFGAYHQFTTNKMMELNNEKIEIQHKYFIFDILNVFGKLCNLLKLIEIPIRSGKLKSFFGRKVILLLSKSNFLSEYNLSIFFGR